MFAGPADRQSPAADDVAYVVGQLSSMETWSEIQAILRASVRQLIGSDGFALILREDDLCFYVEEDAIGPLWKGKKFSMAACISGWCMLHRRTVSIPDIAMDPRIPHDLYVGTFVRSLIMAPIVAERSERSIGAIGSYWARIYAASPDQITTLERFARAIGTALERVLPAR